MAAKQETAPAAAGKLHYRPPHSSTNLLLTHKFPDTAESPSTDDTATNGQLTTADAESKTEATEEDAEQAGEGMTCTHAPCLMATADPGQLSSP
jgi:hypothetical protein